MYAREGRSEPIPAVVYTPIAAPVPFAIHAKETHPPTTSPLQSAKALLFGASRPMLDVNSGFTALQR